MQRDCLDQIVKWNGRRNRKPLVLMGARQVGKTWLMEEFARREFPKDHVVVNFMRKRSLCEQLKNGDIDPASLVGLLQTATGKLIVPGKTLLVLDEIQECPSALTALKFFQEDMPQLAVMAAGSLLGLSFGLFDLAEYIAKADNFLLLCALQFQINLTVVGIDESIEYPRLFFSNSSVIANGLANQHNQIPSLESDRYKWWQFADTRLLVH